MTNGPQKQFQTPHNDSFEKIKKKAHGLTRCQSSTKVSQKSGKHSSDGSVAAGKDKKLLVPASNGVEIKSQGILPLTNNYLKPLYNPQVNERSRVHESKDTSQKPSRNPSRRNENFLVFCNLNLFL